SQAGLNMMCEQAYIKEAPLTQNFIRQLHKVLLRENYTVYKNLPGGSTTSYVVHAGQYKTRPNSVITRYGNRFDYASPEETPALMTDLVDWYNEAEKSGNHTPVELAALFHYRYIRIHPFEDGNGRVARLMVNYILARHGWPMIVVRSRNKYHYLEALRQTDQTVGNTPSNGAHASKREIGKFITYLKGLIATELKYYIDFVEETSPNVWWFDGQKIVFKSNSGPKILDEINSEPDITIDELSKRVGIVPRAVKRLIKNMTEKGYIQRIGSDKNWYVFATQSI
ncbi:MAG: Fic family protein, partial [Muribaculaceae bacterium]|nr:Fic family protein [Muribaculaceae bacterium]